MAFSIAPSDARAALEVVAVDVTRRRVSYSVIGGGAGPGVGEYLCVPIVVEGVVAHLFPASVDKDGEFVLTVRRAIADRLVSGARLFLVRPGRAARGATWRVPDWIAFRPYPGDRGPATPHLRRKPFEIRIELDGAGAYAMCRSTSGSGAVK